MKLNIIDEVELYKQCSKFIHELPDYLKSSSNSISSTVFFIPLDCAYSRGELLLHLEMLEQGLMDEKTIDSIAGKNVLDLYSRHNASKQTRAQISKLANYIRLVLVKLASNGVLTLNALFKVSIHSQKQFDTVIIYDDVYPESVLQALILSTDARVKSHSDQLPVRLLDAANTELAYKTRVAAYQTLARACLTQGVRKLSDFKFEHWADFYSDYRSTPELPAITISSIISVIAKYNNDPEIENQFKNFTTSHRTNPKEDNSHTESVYLSGDRALAKKLLGKINYNRNHTQYSHSEYVRYSKNDSTKILSYPYWNSDGIVLADFISSNINQNQDHKTVWKLAQIDFLERKVESSTKKVSQNRLAVFNIYLFSYLPSFFSKFGSEHIKYPNLPKDFISAIFVQRSSIFDYQSGIASDAVYPVPLEEFVFSFDLTRRKITTDNDNGIKDVMREISLFFEHLVAINVGNPDSDFFVPTNPIKLSVQKTKGKKYLKTRKQVMSINYWSG
ncbi:hypothetical protein H5202_22350, partial [Shewanella sp. SG41-4]|uniref:hypothetical protein n=1 Tax=Shewanella sp. SG41-4 TaxID=2760976 RepID=UPI0016033DCF